MPALTGPLITIQQRARRLWCYRYVVSLTYEGLMLGGPTEFGNRMQLQALPHEARRLFGEWPVHVIPPELSPGDIAFPAVRIIASFTSGPTRPEMHLSSLVAVWFQHEQFPVPGDAARAALVAMDWERLALDYET